MSRSWWRFAFAALLAVALSAQVSAPQKEQDPPEEDEGLVPKEYSFNPLQAAKELKVGGYYYKKRSYRAAAQRFEEATKWDPNLAEAYLRLGESKEKLRDFKAASDAYKKYVEVAPEAKDVDAVRKRIAKIRPRA